MFLKIRKVLRMVVNYINSEYCRETTSSLSRILNHLLEVRKEIENSLCSQLSRPEHEFSEEQLSEVLRLVGVLLELVHSLIASQVTAEG